MYFPLFVWITNFIFIPHIPFLNMFVFILWPHKMTKEEDEEGNLNEKTFCHSASFSHNC